MSEAVDYPQLRFPGAGGAQGFLAREWQRAPLLMRQALPGFVNPMPADELAGLACESEVEARILIEHPADARWEVLHGPFDADAFAALPPDHWTLLVQDVDKHIPEIGRLLERFRFLPQWRIDDIMISYAADQGSVGPHTDEYDVFLLQAEGRRRWHIAAAADAPSELIPDLEVKVLRHFQPDQEWVLEPGDILYLPPGVPHWGVAEGPCQTWSVGLRAPAWRELADDWLALVAERCMPDGRWRDRQGQVPVDPAELDLDTLSRMRETIIAAVGSASEADFQRWLGAFLTEPKLNLELAPLPQPCSGEEVAAGLRRQGWLDRDGRSQLLLSPPLFAGGPALLFANGQAHEVSGALQPFLSLLANRRRLDLASVRPWLMQPEALRLLAELVSAGHYLWPPAPSTAPPELGPAMREPLRQRPCVVRRADWRDEQATLLAIRWQVFVHEQRVSEDEELDGQDASAVHLIAETESGTAVGTARILPTGQIGRMAVLREHRGRGVGQALLEAALATIAERGWPRPFLNAQTAALGFYRRAGFVSQGAAFLDAGIPHLRMVLAAPRVLDRDR